MSLASETNSDRSYDQARFRTGARQSNNVKRRPFRLGYLVSHPIQYQAPMLRYIARDPDIELTVFYMSDMSVEGFYDAQFKTQVKWDVPLLGGYRYTFLRHVGGADVSPLLRPLVVGLQNTLQQARLDALWLHGYKHQVQLRAIGAARRLGIPILVRGESNVAERRLGDGISARVLQQLFKKIDGFLFIGKQNRQFYAERGVDDRRLFPVPYAVDNLRFQQAVQEASSSRTELLASLNIIWEAPVILYAGKLTSGKRPLDLLAAYHQVVQRFSPGSEPYLIYVGEGQERARLERRIDELKLNRVRITGFINQSELPRYYDLCDVFVLPSQHDRWGLAVNEVMNAGKPIIVTDKVGCAPDLVHDWENGFVVPAGDVVCLASRLLCLLQDSDLRTRMGEASRRLVAEFSFEQDLQGLKKALHEVCGSARDFAGDLVAPNIFFERESHV
jgi:glycosyltransferase involved in cell wall biosynthesis